MREFWAIYKKVYFFPTAPPTFAPFCTFSGQKGIFTEKWQQHLQRLMVFYLYAKKYKKWLNDSKDSNSKITRFLKYCPNLHPFLGVKEWRWRKKFPYHSKSTFQELFKYEIRFSKSLAVVLDIGVYKMLQLRLFTYFRTLFSIFSENENFSEKWCLGQFIPFNAL